MSQQVCTNMILKTTETVFLYWLLKLSKLSSPLNSIDLGNLCNLGKNKEAGPDRAYIIWYAHNILCDFMYLVFAFCACSICSSWPSCASNMPFIGTSNAVFVQYSMACHLLYCLKLLHICISYTQSRYMKQFLITVLSLLNCID